MHSYEVFSWAKLTVKYISLHFWNTFGMSQNKCSLMDNSRITAPGNEVFCITSVFHLLSLPSQVCSETGFFFWGGGGGFPPKNLYFKHKSRSCTVSSPPMSYAVAEVLYQREERCQNYVERDMTKRKCLVRWCTSPTWPDSMTITWNPTSPTGVRLKYLPLPRVRWWFSPISLSRTSALL